MENHKVSRPPDVSVRNRYTIFLCEEDWERLGDRRDQLAAKLEGHLAKHARAKKYVVHGDISVDIVCDPDLQLGRFGILAERDGQAATDGDVPVPRPAGVALTWGPGEDEALGLGLLGPGVAPGAGAGVPRPAGTARPPGVSGSGGRVRRVNREEAPAQPAPGDHGLGSPSTPTAVRGRPSGAEQTNGSTRMIAASEAAELGLIRETIIIRSGNRVREFSQGRVVLGRSADVDFRIDNPDVSRRHAALYWSNGNVVIEDLGSTNGTMVNGYPISSTVVKPNDVIVIGDCRLTVQTR